MAISMQDLQIVETIGRLGTLSRAATHLRLTQPALSWSLKKVEEELATTLFHRTKKGVVPTGAGQIFLNRARTFLRNWSALKDDVQESQDRIKGRFLLGIHGTLAAFTLPRFCPKLLTEHPEIELRLQHDLSRHIHRGVQDFLYDFGIVVNPTAHEALAREKLFDDRIGFWVAEGGGVLQDPSHPDAVWILNPEMAHAEALLSHATAHAGWLTRRVMYTTDLVVIAAMVASGGGIGLLPETLAMGYPSGNLQQLGESPLAHDEIYLVWRAEAQTSMAAQVVMDAVVAGLKTDT